MLISGAEIKICPQNVNIGNRNINWGGKMLISRAEIWISGGQNDIGSQNQDLGREMSILEAEIRFQTSCTQSPIV